MNTLRRIIHLLFFLSTPSALWACDCVGSSLIEFASRADFIFTAKILDHSPDPYHDQLHNVELDITEIFKGEMNQPVKIDSDLLTSCSFLPSKGSQWLIYAYKSIVGNFMTFHYCGGSRQVDRYEHPDYNDTKLKKEYRIVMATELNMLRFLRDNQVNVENPLRLSLWLQEADEIIQNIPIKNSPFDYAIYKVDVATNLVITDIELIKGFRKKKVDNEIMRLMKAHGRIVTQEREESISKASHMYFLLFYYPPGYDGTESFISEFFVL